MDNTSIITQVNRDEEQFGHYGSSMPLSTATPKQTKPRNRSFWRSLFTCCTGRNQTPDQVIPPPNGHTAPSQIRPLLGPPRRDDVNKKCVIIDLDETLVHSSFKPVQDADFIVPVDIEGTVHQVYVLKRPYVDEFLQKMGQLFECVLFTASLAKYADPVADLLDKWDVFRTRLFRESCVFHRGNYVKDLSRLGREIEQIAIVDNSPASYLFHPGNAIPVASWFDDTGDTELLDLIPFMEGLAKVDNVIEFLKNANHNIPHASQSNGTS